MTPSPLERVVALADAGTRPARPHQVDNARPRWAARHACAALVCLFGAAAVGCSRPDVQERINAGQTSPSRVTQALTPPIAGEDVESGHHHEHFVTSDSVVTDHGIPLFQITQFDEWPPEERARRIAARLNLLTSTHSIEPEHLAMERVAGRPTVFYLHHHGGGDAGHVIATVDPLTALQFGCQNDPDRLGFWWRDVLRDHLLIISGQPPRWTAPYTPVLTDLYNRLHEILPGVPDHEAFDQALSTMSPDKIDALRSLYRTVPAGYVPEPNIPDSDESTG